MYDSEIERMSVRDTAKGIAVRAGLLAAGALIVGAWLFSLAAKIASGTVKVLVGALLLGTGAGVAAYEVKKFKRRFGNRNLPPSRRV